MPKETVKKNLMKESKLTFIQYTGEKLIRKEVNNLDNLFDTLDDGIIWLNVIGLDNVEIINSLADILKFHPLVKEHILNTSQGPKLNDYEDYLFLIAKNVSFKEKGQLTAEQICFLLYKDKVISFQERESDIFDSILDRLKEGTYIRKNGSDDLLYSLLDSIVDNYFKVIEELGQDIDIVEDKLLTNPNHNLLNGIYKLKRELILLRNILWPMRNLISSLSKNDYDLIDYKTVH